MLTFDYNSSTRKIQIRSEDKDLFDRIREHFSVENEGARFARYRGRFAARRKYAITGTGACEIGLYWEIRQYLIREQIKVDIEITDKLNKILKVGKYINLFSGKHFLLKELIVNPKSSISLQKHNFRSERWTIISGKPKITIDNKKFFSKQNESIFVPKGAIHRIENNFKVPVKIIEVQMGSVLKENDIIRYEDIYGRVKQ